MIKRWHRSQPLAAATTVYEARPGDVSAWVAVDHTPGHERTVVGRSPDFYTTEEFLLVDGRLQPLAKPADAQLGW